MSWAKKKKGPPPTVGSEPGSKPVDDSIIPKKYSQLMIVNSAVDDAGLSPAEFRIYGHFCRVGVTWEKIKNLAKVCRVHPDTAWDAIAELERRGMIDREQRSGMTSIFRITPISKWKVKPTGKGGAGSHPSDSGEGDGKGGAGGTGKRGATPTGNGGAQRISLKEIPLKQSKKGDGPSVFLSEFLGRKKSIEQRLQEIRNQGRDGKPMPEHAEEFKALKLRLREVTGQINGVPVSSPKTEPEQSTPKVKAKVMRECPKCGESDFRFEATCGKCLAKEAKEFAAAALEAAK